MKSRLSMLQNCHHLQSVVLLVVGMSLMIGCGTAKEAPQPSTESSERQLLRRRPPPPKATNDPNIPSAEAIQTLIDENFADFVNVMGSSMVNREQFNAALMDINIYPPTSDDQGSLSLQLLVTYQQIVSDSEVATFESEWEGRIYRDDPSSPWQSILGLEKVDTRAETARQTLTADEVAQMQPLIAQ